jgi:hypothetical protein
VTQDGEKVMTEVAQKQLHYFSFTSHLKRLFISKKTAGHMRWHKEGIHENNGIMGHPLDGEAWKVLDRFDADFASDVRNVRLGLATDDFDPFSTNSAPYSCWPVFAMSYNLPLSHCMKFEFMFLCLIVPGLKAPGPRINVMLKQLWIGVEVYDCYKKQKFNLRAAYLWLAHDFKEYNIFTDWSVHGELTCLKCGSDTYCFHLTHGGKISYFNCHRRWLPRKHNFRQEQNTFRKDTTITKGPSKHLSSTQIVDMLDKLMPNPETHSISMGTERHTIGLINVHYESFRTCRC